MNVTRLLMIVVVAIGGWFGWQYSQKAPVPVFETAAVQQGELQSVVSATGTCSALVTVDVGVQLSGIITALYADFDTSVKKGQLLAELDPTQFKAKVEGAQAALNSANAGLISAKAAERATEDSVLAARSDAERYKASMKTYKAAEQHAKLEADRQAQLGPLSTADDKATALNVYNSAVSDSAGAAAQQETATVAINEQLAQVEAAKGQVDAAVAQVNQAEASLQQAQVDLDHTRIVSPIDGIVLAREVSVGQTVAASSVVPVLFQIAQDLSKVQVDVNLDESDVSRVASGNSATFNVDAFPGRTFDAQVRQVREEATNISNVITYDVVLDVLHPPVELFPGMTTNVRILSIDRPDVVKIPNAALRFRPFDPTAKVGSAKAATPGVPSTPGPAMAKGSAYVYVLDDTGKPVQRTVIQGITDGQFTEMVSGDLHAGDKVVVLETLKT